MNYILIFETIVLLYFGLSAVYIFVFSVAGSFFDKNKMKRHTRTSDDINLLRKVGVFIPSYKNDEVIISTVKRALIQDYPRDLYDIIVIADSLKFETLTELKKLPIKLVEVCFREKTKYKSIAVAMQNLNDDYKMALVFDDDNEMEFELLKKLNNSFDKGFKVVQVHRVAKNTETDIAILDSISEEINNSIFRKGYRALGVSCSLIGSGMAFDYNLLKGLINNVDTFGEDRTLELELALANVKVEYADNAIIFSKKVDTVNDMINQRKNWLSAQLYVAIKYLSNSDKISSITNTDYFNKIVQQFLPPRIIMLGVAFLFVIGHVIMFYSNVLLFNYVFIAWIIVATLTVLAVCLAIPKRVKGKGYLNAFVNLPKGFYIMTIAMFSVFEKKKRVQIINKVYNKVNK